MLVRIRSFGSVWSSRYKSTTTCRFHTTVAALYNSTGIRSGNRIRYFWRVGGHLRINSHGSGFNPHFPSRSLNGLFECDALHEWNGINRLAVLRKGDPLVRPEYYLITVDAHEIGHTEGPDRDGWKAPGVEVVAFSERGSEQEMMLLMPAYSWINAGKGTFVIEPSAVPSRDGTLRLVRERRR